MKISDKIVSVFLPHKCTFCREATEYNNYTFICKSCMKKLPFIKGSRCLKCNTPQEATAMPVCYNCRKHRHTFLASFTPLIYKDEVQRAIVSMKFYQKDSFCHSFAYLITNNIISSGYPDIDFVTYIPISKERFKERGFNQAELIANECGKILNIPVIDTLIRVEGTPRQSTLSHSERRKNAKISFKAKNIPLKGTALLIDDVYTTGSTLSFTSSLLLKMGCDKVYIATVALREKK